MTSKKTTTADGTTARPTFGQRSGELTDLLADLDGAGVPGCRCERRPTSERWLSLRRRCAAPLAVAGRGSPRAAPNPARTLAAGFPTRARPGGPTAS